MSIAPDAYAFVQDLVRRESAIVLGPGKEYLVESRLLPLARSEGAPTIEAFVATVRKQPSGAASRRLVEALTTNETSWFRDGEPYAALVSTVVPELVRTRATSRRLRVWCGASSSGQEPYSISMALGDARELAGWSIDIVGTDLAESMVRRCQEGHYSQLEVNRGLPVKSLVKHFDRDGAGWRVNKELASRCSFRTLNLMRPFPPMGRFDVVFLRNVLIYFDVAAKRDVLRRVRQVLAPDGFLFLGAAETTTGLDDAWERVAVGRCSIYRLRKDAV